MGEKMRRVILIIFIILSTLCFSIELTESEKEYIKKQKQSVLEIGYIGENNVFRYKDIETGEVEGVYTDLFAYISRLTGLKFNMSESNEKRNYDIIINLEEIQEKIERDETDYLSPIEISEKNIELSKIIEEYYNEFSKEKLGDSIKKHRVKYYKSLISGDDDYLEVKRKIKVLKVRLSEEEYLMPFYYYKNGEYYGYLPDYYRTVGEILEIPVEFFKGKSDEKNLEYHIDGLDGTLIKKDVKGNQLYKSRISILGHTKNKFISELGELSNYKVGVKESADRNSTFLKNKIYIDSYEEAFKDLVDGKIDYIVGDFKVLSNLVGNFYLGEELKIVGVLPEEFYIYPKIENGNDELERVIRKITKPYLGESYLLKEKTNSPNIIKLDYKKGVGIFLIVFILIIPVIIYRYKLKNEHKKREIMVNSLVESLEMANNYNDEDTGSHVVRVSLYAELLAKKYGGSKKLIEEIRKYSSLHDIGKIGIPDSILKKQGKLSEEEMDVMKTHVDIGYELIKKMKLGKIAENIVRYHHEKWNGKGYLLGIREKDIPLEARIVSLVDVYDALRQKRSYKEGFSHERAVEIIKGDSGKAFDPKLVEIFLENQIEFQEIYSSNN